MTTLPQFSVKIIIIHNRSQINRIINKIKGILFGFWDVSHDRLIYLDFDGEDLVESDGGQVIDAIRYKYEWLEEDSSKMKK